MGPKDLHVCISVESLDDADTTGPGTTLGEPSLYTLHPSPAAKLPHPLFGVFPERDVRNN